MRRLSVLDKKQLLGASCSDAARPNGRVWDYISPSRLNAWLRCPLAFRLRYIDGIPTGATPSLLLGKAVHVGLETHYRAVQRNVAMDAAEATGQTARAWERLQQEEAVPFATRSEEARLKKQAVGLVLLYLGEVRHEKARPLEVEVAWEAPLVDPASGKCLPLPLVGVVDLVLDGNEGPVIVDFKTAARGGDPLDVVHEVQLTAYALLFRHVPGRREAGLEIRRLVRTKKPKFEVYRFPPRAAGVLQFCGQSNLLFPSTCCFSNSAGVRYLRDE